MLVLKRKKTETIVLDGRIQIKVLRISHNAISLGIEAPSDVSIWRGELEQADQPAMAIASAGIPAARPLAQLAWRQQDLAIRPVITSG